MSSKSELEETLNGQLIMLQAPAFKREYRFAPGRRYRFDFAFPEVKLGVEINGGIWLDKSGHNTGVGLQNGYAKLNLACERGWFVLQYDSSSIRSGEAVLQILRVLSNLEKSHD